MRWKRDLLGITDDEPVARRLRTGLAVPQLTPRHAHDLLTAFRMDVTKLRYQDWDDADRLLPLFGDAGRPLRARRAWREPRSTWPANDALCAALQINNHLQDCGNDFRDLDRVYIPLDALAAAGAEVDDLGAGRSLARAAALPA